METLKDKEKRIEDLNGQLDSSNQRVAALEEELENTIKKGAELDENNKSLDDRWVQYRQITTKAL